MKSYFEEVSKLEDGTYLIDPDKGIINYAERWAYGYIVGIRTLDMTDLKNYALFGVWTDEDGTKHWDVVKHVGAIQDARKLAADFDQKCIWDLRDEKVVHV